jgi:hypothetical protein
MYENTTDGDDATRRLTEVQAQDLYGELDSWMSFGPGCSGAVSDRRRPLKLALRVSSNYVELDSVDGRVVIDWSRMRSSPAKRIAIGFTRSSNVDLRNRRERKQVDVVNLNYRPSDGILVADFDTWFSPQTHGNRNPAAGDAIS